MTANLTDINHPLGDPITDPGELKTIYLEIWPLWDHRS